VTSSSWQSALDRLEAELTAIEDALAEGRPAPVETTTALPSVPLPPDLAPRAEQLLERTRRLEDRAAEELDGIRDALRALPGRRPPAATKTGRIIDVGA